MADPITTPTVVLVHGAFADGSSWYGVIEHLQAAGLTAVAPANPLRGLENDVAYISNVVRSIPGPVLLVGHSYGGVVITSVGSRVDNAVGLVYVAALAPEEGESSNDISAKYPPMALGPALRPASAATSPEEHDYLVAPELYHSAFAADLPEDVTRIHAATQRPFVGWALATPSGTPAAWKTLPSWFAVALGDKAIHPDQQRFYAERMGAIVAEIDGSHAVAESQPKLVADLIISAARSVASS
jgi:pimeloyl-ACP methyl ester carboxylesterase